MGEFLKKLFSNSTEVSSKRVSGISGWIVFLCITIGVVMFSTDLKPGAERIVNTLAITSAALVGGGTVAEIIKGKQNKQ